MSFAQNETLASGWLKAGILMTGVMAFPLALLMALEAIFVFGSWEESWHIRLPCIGSPLYILLLLKAALSANRRGMYLLSATETFLAAAPALAVVALMIWVVSQS
ncbi:hypothetical protein [Sphingobium sp. CR28]|uniref:hypothetical protein n=1 Tax=Sphingobium sp. CR28 TaxID=3400272 RepID=UPI003FED9E9A